MRYQFGIVLLNLLQFTYIGRNIFYRGRRELKGGWKSGG